ncbi:MAG: FkbM family methyltransferase [Acidimicrobiales bacterium]
MTGGVHRQDPPRGRIVGSLPDHGYEELVQRTSGMEQDRKFAIKNRVLDLTKAAHLYPVVRRALTWTPSRRRVSIGCRNLYAQFVTPGDLCFDIGANIGTRVKVLLSLGARVIAVEPQATCCQILSRFESKNMTVVAAGVSEQPGTALLRSTSADTIASMSDAFISRTTASGRFAAYAWDAGSEVPVTTLDLLIGEYGLPSFVKIDVEGYEGQVIRGLHRPVRALSFEACPEMLDVTSACVDHLTSIGDYEFAYSPAHSMELAGDWAGAATLIARLRRLESGCDWGDVYARLKAT